MKILLLISGLLFSGGLFADMDYICPVSADSSNNPGGLTTGEHIYKYCERNNIVHAYHVTNVVSFIGYWCRFDREIHYDDFNELTCVLYDKESRDSVYSIE
ncbi:hypothetical protein OAC39_00190 [Gammaproteobacteria bacterium]|nr:hypothetical protein [Gammaproteobacteria bacterium]